MKSRYGVGIVSAVGKCVFFCFFLEAAQRGGRYTYHTYVIRLTSLIQQQLPGTYDCPVIPHEKVLTMSPSAIPLASPVPRRARRTADGAWR